MATKIAFVQRMETKIASAHRMANIRFGNANLTKSKFRPDKLKCLVKTESEEIWPFNLKITFFIS